MAPPRFLVVAFPQRGAMNPVRQLADRLARVGGRVTFLTTVYAHRCMINPVCFEDVTFTTFSDGYDNGYVPGDDLECFRAEIKRRGFDIFYYYFNGYEDVIKNVASQRENKYAFALPQVQTLLENVKEGENPKVVLVNTFNALELEALRAIGTLNLVGIGSLVPLGVLDSEKSSGSDRFLGSEDYVEWLNTKEEASVIYVAFGSIARLSKAQKQEMACGLLETGRPFLWAMRKSDGDDDELFYKEELDKRGVTVPWCSQIEVLSHPSIGCFFTHCEWNSTVESLVCGIPMVAFPQWANQMTNAKLVEDVWKVGIRVSETNEEGIIVEGGEIKKCLELVMGGGERGDEIRKNVKKWKDLIMEVSQGRWIVGQKSQGLC
ncbi:hypothetical protein NL676_021634 [Syzygium grande]|nr:hypothetical protein NL676_021634 [Syzygium grande]